MRKKLTITLDEQVYDALHRQLGRVNQPLHRGPAALPSLIRRMRLIFYFAKVFTEAEYADRFIRGEMYCRQLSWFKKLEDQDGRGDTDEGAIVPQLEGLVMTLEAVDPDTGEVVGRHTIQDFAAPPVLTPEWFDHINVFCMFAAHSSEFEHESFEVYLDHVKEHLKMPEKYVRLGEHAVVITDATEFLRRVEKAAHRSGYGILWGLVKYYDSQVGTPPMRSDIETIFSKRNKYAYQREFRFAIDTGKTEGRTITLDIGDIGDIALRTNTVGIRWEINTLS